MYKFNNSSKYIYMNRNCISMCLLLALGEIYRQYSTPHTPEAC